MPCIYVSFKNPPIVPQSVQIGPIGTSNITDTPLDGLFDFSQSGMIYLSSQLSAIANKQITAIEFQYNGWGTTYTVNNQIIKMGHSQTTTDYFNSSEPIDYSGTLIGSLVTVKNSFTFSNIGAGGGPTWIKHDFDNYFTYNGTDNLLISWENRDGSWASGYGWVEGNSSSGRTVANWWLDNSYPTSTSNQTQNRQPNLIIHYQ